MLHSVLPQRPGEFRLCIISVIVAWLLLCICFCSFKPLFSFLPFAACSDCCICFGCVFFFIRRSWKLLHVFPDGNVKTIPRLVHRRLSLLPVKIRQKSKTVSGAVFSVVGNHLTPSFPNKDKEGVATEKAFGETCNFSSNSQQRRAVPCNPKP